jgi:hypothetical protein
MGETDKKKSWFKRHWLLLTLLVVAIIVISAFINEDSNPKSESSISGSNVLNENKNVSSDVPSLKYTPSDVEKMSLSKKLDLCTKDLAGDSIDIPQVKDECYASCYQIYYYGGEEALDEYILGLSK